MTSSETDRDEIHAIDMRLSDIDAQIESLHDEKQLLLVRRNELTSASSSSKKQQQQSSANSQQRNEASAANWNRSDFAWSGRVNEALRDVFRLTSFRPLQLETVNATLSRQDCLVVMPTGAGKSLCFHLPAWLDEGITLVVSPLISLVEDQLWILRSLNIHAETLNASSSKEHVKQIHSDMCDPQSDLKLLFVTPEKLAKSKMFMNKLEKTYAQNRLARLAIDEVHCCSTYGHDFRPDYKFLGVMKSMFPKLCVLGLTATATQAVIDDVKKILNIPRSLLFKSSFNRPNIFYEVREKPAAHDSCMDAIAQLIKSDYADQSGIVYCFSQRESEQVAIDLRSRGIRADVYHAQIDAKQRSQVHDKWLGGRLHVIVATIAFGMGINKSNCRFVIHHTLSKSLENFYQESGRAGRDGLPARSVLFFRYADIFRQSTMVFTEQTGLANLHSMVTYCIDKAACKRSLIAQHFGEHWTDACHAMCDVCKSRDARLFVAEAVDCIDEARQVIDLLEKRASSASSSDKDKTRLTANKLAELAYAEFGKSKGASKEKHTLSQSEVEHLLLSMLMQKYLREDFHFTPYNTICYLIAGPRASLLRASSARFNISLIRSASTAGKEGRISKRQAQNDDTTDPKPSTKSIFKTAKASNDKKVKEVKECFEVFDDDDDLVFETNDMDDCFELAINKKQKKDELVLSD